MRQQFISLAAYSRCCHEKVIRSSTSFSSSVTWTSSYLTRNLVSVAITNAMDVFIIFSSSSPLEGIGRVNMTCLMNRCSLTLDEIVALKYFLHRPQSNKCDPFKHYGWHLLYPNKSLELHHQQKFTAKESLFYTAIKWIRIIIINNTIPSQNAKQQIL